MISKERKNMNRCAIASSRNRDDDEKNTLLYIEISLVRM